MKRVACFLLFGFLGLAGLAHLYRPASAASTIKPVTIVYQRTIFPDGSPANISFSRTETLGIRDDGSVSRADWKPATAGHPAYSTLLITDVASGKYTIVDPFTESRTTYRSPGMAEHHRVKPASTCPGTAGEQILGFETVVEDKTSSFPDRRLTIRYWRAPHLNCLPLREEDRTMLFKTGKQSLQVLNATSITLDEPSASMFEVPSVYTERTPSEVMAESSRKLGRNPLPPNANLDKVYADSQ